MTILLTGATGQVGGAALRALADLPVRALVRDPATPPGGGVDVVAGSFDDGASLRAALDGVSVLFLTGRDNPAQVEQHLRVLDVAREVGVRHVVKLSAIGARADSPVALMRWHHAIEAALRGSGFAWTFLRPHLYLQNLLRFAGDVAGRGRLAAPMGDRRYPLVDTRDVGAAVAAVLRDPHAHIGRVYGLTGPSAVSYAEVAAHLARLVGRPVEYEALAPDVFRAGLVDAGVPAWRADDLAAISSAYEDEAVADDLPALLGRSATSLEAFLDDHRELYLVGASRSHL
ncbi:MAG TPA: SDR family oxidoreductase [Solirubrobacter sp.]